MDRHGIIRIELDQAGSSPTARARCSCGVWRQAGAYGDHSGTAGAILLVSDRFDCAGSALWSFRVANPFPADQRSVERADEHLEQRAAGLRSQAARLLIQADEYDAARERLGVSRQTIYRALDKKEN